MEYEVDPNAPNVSTTLDQGKDKKWNLEEVYESPFTIDMLMETLNVLDSFKRKYPENMTVKNFELLVREEICLMFGGKLDRV